MRYRIEIAEIVIELEIPFRFFFSKNVTEFEAKGIKVPDVILRIQKCKSMKVLEKNKICSVCPRVYSNQDGYIKEYTMGENNTAFAWLYQKKDLLKWRFYYRKGWEKQIAFMSEIINCIDIETIGNRNGAILLHASLIIWNRKAILFSGPSGIGKSTQAALWEQEENAEIINGDRAFLRKREGVWKAYGLPVAGSSQIFKNKSAPIQCLIILSQGKENRIHNVTVREAFTAIYRESIIHTWDREYVERAINEISSFISEVPIISLSCLPDYSAVEYVKKYLKGTDK